jgi:hypothetical protein
MQRAWSCSGDSLCRGVDLEEAEPIATSSSSPDKYPKPKEKPNHWLHIAFARVFSLLVSHVGTEIALGKGKTSSRGLIVSVIPAEKLIVL